MKLCGKDLEEEKEYDKKNCRKKEEKKIYIKEKKERKA